MGRRKLIKSARLGRACYETQITRSGFWMINGIIGGLMPIDLTTRLIKSQTDSGELECFLTTSFSSSSQTEPDRVVYGDQVAVEYNKKKWIKKIEWLDDASAGDANKLVQDADTALYDDVGMGIARSIFFAGKPIRGCSAYKR